MFINNVFFACLLFSKDLLAFDKLDCILVSVVRYDNKLNLTNKLFLLLKRKTHEKHMRTLKPPGLTLRLKPAGCRLEPAVCPSIRHLKR